MSDLTPERLAEIRKFAASDMTFALEAAMMHELLAALDAAEKERDEFRNGQELLHRGYQERVAVLEKERDEAIAQMNATLKSTAQSLWDERPLNMKVAELEKALREIRDNPTVTIHGLSCDKLDAREIAAEALANIPECPHCHRSCWRGFCSCGWVVPDSERVWPVEDK